jgi:hypothetical protein
MRGDSDDDALDWIIPLPRSRRSVPDAKHIRSTWLTASQAALREHGLGSRYEALLDPKYRDEILGAVPGVWLPMEIARAHYLACDALALPTETLLDMGKSATRRANASTLAFVRRVAQGTGATPWTMLSQGARLWQRTCDGGALGIARLGPKEARLHMVGLPLASIHYNRVTIRGIAIAVAELFCQKAYARELARPDDAHAIVLRLSWV